MTKFTVFYQGGFLTDGNCGCHALEDFLTETVVGGMPPIAWAPVCYWDWARQNPGRDCDELRAESIAAGRTIELIDGKYVPRGVPVEDKPAVQEICPDCHGHTVLYCGTCATACKPTTERTRPALTWADSKRVDRFPGYVVERGAVKHDEYNPPERVLHPLQRIAQEGDQLHGSAWLRKG
jgi:hypothetical protein